MPGRRPGWATLPLQDMDQPRSPHLSGLRPWREEAGSWDSEALSLSCPRLGIRRSPLPFLTWRQYPLAPRTAGLVSETDMPGGTDTGTWAPLVVLPLSRF